MNEYTLSQDEETVKTFLIKNMPDYLPIDEILLKNVAISIVNLNYMNERLQKNKACCIQDRQFMSARDKFVKEVESGLKMLDVTPQARRKAVNEPAKIIDPLTELLG